MYVHHEHEGDLLTSLQKPHLDQKELEMESHEGGDSGCVPHRSCLPTTFPFLYLVFFLGLVFCFLFKFKSKVIYLFVCLLIFLRQSYSTG